MGRIVDPTKPRKYQLKTLNELHRECIRLSLLGWKPTAIARFLGVTEPTVCNAVNSAKGQMQLALMRGARDADTIDLAQDIQEFAGRAWEIAKDLIDSPNVPDTVRLKYCFEAVGLAGHVKPQRIQHSGSVTHLTNDEINELKVRARQLANEAGIIDGDFTELPTDSPAKEGRLSDGPSCDLDEEKAKMLGREQRQQAAHSEEVHNGDK